MSTTQQKNQHLLWRAGFGPAADDLNQLSLLTPQDLYFALKKTSANRPGYLDATGDYFNGFFKGIGEEGKRRQMDKDGLMATQPKSGGPARNLNLLWLDEMVYSTAQLREKMAFFWHGHFASRNLNVFFQQELLHVLRQHALGSFRNLLHEVSKSAAVLFFLNAAENVKARPNENFAREVMELFTLGRGAYTENDVKEAARAFTGWGAGANGRFAFRKNGHDDGRKTVLGISGNLGGEDVLDILLSQKETARFIAKKIYRFFVNETVDEAKVDRLADRFYKTDYDIGALMDDVFTADWFYAERNIGTRIKSPVELLAGIRRLLPMELANGESQLLLQRLLGQVLFIPPNVAGWPGGKAWIDSTTLMYRLRLPQWLYSGEEMNATPKRDDDLMAGSRAANVSGRPPAATIDWKAYAKNFEPVEREKLLDALSASVLQVVPSFSPAFINRYTGGNSRESFIKSATIRLMSTPEYQLC